MGPDGQEYSTVVIVPLAGTARPQLASVSNALPNVTIEAQPTAEWCAHIVPNVRARRCVTARFRR